MAFSGSHPGCILKLLVVEARPELPPSKSNILLAAWRGGRVFGHPRLAPLQGAGCSPWGSGGVAALDPRLMSETPLGSGFRMGPPMGSGFRMRPPLRSGFRTPLQGERGPAPMGTPQVSKLQPQAGNPPMGARLDHRRRPVARAPGFPLLKRFTVRPPGVVFQDR